MSRASIYSLLHRVHGRLRSEEGFSITEATAAMGVILVGFMAMAYTSTIGFKYIGLARQRQSATGLANQVMEQIRALPFDTLKRGLGNTDLQTTTDPNITPHGNATTYTYTGTNERIPHGNNPTVTPLVPHQRTTTVGPTTYTEYAYVTYYGNNLTAATFRAVVVVTWTSLAKNAVPGRVVSQTLLYSPKGCVSTATHPFASPCQPFLYGDASAAQGTITVSGTVQSIDLDHASIWSIGLSSDMQAEQISAVQGAARRPGIELQLTGGAVQSYGRESISSGADNDPAQPDLDYATASSSGESSGSLSSTANNNAVAATLTVASGGTGGTASTTSTTSSSGSHPCPNITGVTNQTDGLACGGSSVTPGSTRAITVTLNNNGVNAGTASLASIAPPTGPSTAVTDRGLSTGDGLLSVSMSRSLGEIRVGGLLDGLAAAAVPAAWAGYLIQITGFSESISAQAGVGTSAPTASRSGTLKYWNGNGYTTVTLGIGNPVAIPVSTVHILDNIQGAPVNVDIAGAVGPSGAVDCNTWVTGCPTTGGTATTSTANGTTRTAASASAASPLVADISYKVTKGGSVVADMVIHFDLGTLLAKASYQASPSA
jgi:hypothetical protein